jgi:hypothetical protein
VTGVAGTIVDMGSTVDCVCGERGPSRSRVEGRGWTAYPDGITKRPGRTEAFRLGGCNVELSGRDCVDGACAVVCWAGAYVVGPNATADPLR